MAISPNDSGDLTLAFSRADGDRAILWLTAGIAGTTYAVTVVIGTQSGRMVSRTIGLTVMALATPMPFGDVITDQAGTPLTDQTDGPITIS